MTSTCLDITKLPHELFLLVTLELLPGDCVRCRRVSRSWRAAFADSETALFLLRRFFPRCREARAATGGGGVSGALTAVVTGRHDWHGHHGDNGRCESQPPLPPLADWATVFALVARRYHHLRSARPRTLQKIPMPVQTGDKSVFLRAVKCKDDALFRFRGIATWIRALHWDGRKAPFHYPDAMWSYSQADGLLAYPGLQLGGQRRERDENEAMQGSSSLPRLSGRNNDEEETSGRYAYQILDLETEASVQVPLDVSNKIIRRVRLNDGVLVVEWAEAEPYPMLDERGVVHRHFVTAFDVLRRRITDGQVRLSVTFRCEWAPPFVGLPLNNSDRFFSAHTASHYAMYIWQPCRSGWEEGQPIEGIAVWDISQRSGYRPSLDSDGEGGSQGRRAGPVIIRRLLWGQLDFYGLRQHWTPRLRNLVLDDTSLYFVEEEHRWTSGDHSSLVPPRVHLVKVTAIPVVPAGISSAGENPFSFEGKPVQGPCWVDQCGANGDINMNFCWRASGRRPPRHQMGVDDDDRPPGWPWNIGLASDADGPSAAAHALSPSCGKTTRWAGWAPCWRHEDFPYLTVSEMVDFDAGVRITARQCFMLETLSVHARPALSVRTRLAVERHSSRSSSSSRKEEGGKEDNDSKDDDLGKNHPGSTKLRGHLPFEQESSPGIVPRGAGNENSIDYDGGRCDEVQFGDEMWDELLAKGHIAGDERWIIGEDCEGRITIARFD